MIKNKKDLKYYIDSDKRQLALKKRSFLSELLFPNNISKFQILLRKLEFYHNTNCNYIQRIKNYLFFINIEI
jgi:hypothetical protein